MAERAFQVTKILLSPDNIEYNYDVHHSNAINFTDDDQWLSIQRSIVADEGDDPIFKKCNFATNNGNLIGYIDVGKIEFKKYSIIISFSSVLAGADSEQPRISPARGPPLWDDCSDAQMDDGAQTEPADWDLAAQPAPDFEVDPRISW